MTTTGTPSKVLRLAAELGAHPDCIAADYEGACAFCRATMHQALADTYGHLGFMDSVLAIMEDLEEDSRG